MTMNDQEAKVLRADLVEQMLKLNFWLGAETQILPDTTENPEKVLQFRRTDGAEVFMTIKR